MLQRLEAGLGESPEVGGIFSELWRKARSPLPFFPAQPVETCFHALRVSKHWKICAKQHGRFKEYCLFQGCICRTKSEGSPSLFFLHETKGSRGQYVKQQKGLLLVMPHMHNT